MISSVEYLSARGLTVLVKLLAEGLPDRVGDTLHEQLEGLAGHPDRPHAVVQTTRTIASASFTSEMSIQLTRV
jgi:hypothetical protein